MSRQHRTLHSRFMIWTIVRRIRLSGQIVMYFPEQQLRLRLLRRRLLPRQTLHQHKVPVPVRMVSSSWTGVLLFECLRVRNGMNVVQRGKIALSHRKLAITTAGHHTLVGCYQNHYRRTEAGPPGHQAAANVWGVHPCPKSA